MPQRVDGVCGRPLEFYGYQFLDPSIARFDERFLPFVGGFESIYEQYGIEATDIVQERDNIDEWYERYCEAVRKKDLRAIIYGESENRLGQLRLAIANPDSRLGDLPPNMRSNTFVRYLLKHRCAEVVDYLLFAKKAEPLVTAPRNRFAKAPPRGNAMKTLVNEGLGTFPTVKSHYLRLRYAYQLLRLSHYRGDYEHVLELYDYLMPKIDADPSLIYHWIEGHHAGALLFVGRRTEAAYKFSRIFIECPSKRESAYRSFSVRTDAEWQDLLNRCKNDQERADLYVLRAQNDRANLIEEMASIYALDPDNRGLEMLLVREMKLLEKEFLGDDVNPRRARNRRLGIPRPDARDRLINLQAFVLTVLESGQVARPELWKLASGYLHLLAGDFHYARRAFWTVEPDLSNDTLVRQLGIFRRVLDVLAISQLNDSLESVYFDLLGNEEFLAQYPHFDNLIYDKFRDVYQDNNERGKAFLLTHELKDLRYNLDIGLIQEFRALAADTNDNSFERRLLLDRGGPDAEFDLVDMEATYYLQRGQVKLANKIFRELPAERWNSYGSYSPFIQRINDRINRRTSDTLRLYNKAEWLQRLIDLEEEAELSTDPEIAARNYFTIGLAHYNVSYFGYSWRAADYFRDSRNAARVALGGGKDYVFPTDRYDNGNYENMSMELARYYFERARRTTLNIETGAKAAFYAAKAERNQFYADGRPGGRRAFGYFGLLRDYYSESNFYQRAIEECRTFAWFTGNLALPDQ